MIHCYIESLGCARNTVESELIMARLRAAGFALTGRAEDADCVIVNSCGFIKSAKLESIKTLIEYKERYPDKKIVLAGCLAVRYGTELRESLPEADALFEKADTASIGEWLRAQYGGQMPAPPASAAAPAVAAAAAAPAPFIEGTRPLLSPPGSAYVRVSEGCVNRCAYCAIPAIRGPLKSRPVEEVIAECALLLQRGVKELCFVAQDLSSYGLDLGGKPLLPALLERVRSLKGDFWARLLYLHPDHFPLDIVPIIRSDPRLLSYFDIPFQHASASLLRAMNRSGSADAYLTLIQTLRGALPGAVIRSTFLAGFPGESERDFEALLDFQQKAALDWMGCFIYSREEGTPASQFKGAVPRETAKARKKALARAQAPLTRAALRKAIGNAEPVLVEKKLITWDAAEEADTPEHLYIGRLRRHAPEVDAFATIHTRHELAEGIITEGAIQGLTRFNLDISC